MLESNPHNIEAKNSRGAYGFAISGISEAYLTAADPGWPLLTIDRELASGGVGTPGESDIDEDHALVWITTSDRVELDRESLAVRFITREPLDDRVLVHPYLSLPVSIASFWLGRQTLHGGAFRHGGRAWALVGAREAGKSSSLGWLMAQGLEIISDDLLVLDAGVVFPGPRSVDLRGDAARILGGEEMGKLGNRFRWRLRPGEPGPATPVAGMVQLEWGDEVAIEQLGAQERLKVLLANVAVKPRPAESQAYLELAALPAWRFTRPRGLEGLDSAIPQLLEVLSQAL